MFAPISEESICETIRIYRENGYNQSATALAMGIARTSVQHRLRRAAERGLLGFDPVLLGFAIKQISTQEDAQGNIKSRSIQQVKEPGEIFEVPTGHCVKGVSTLVDAEGRAVQTWIKTRENSIDPEQICKDLEAHFSDFKPAAPRRPKSGLKCEDQLTLIPWADPHFGLHVWRGDTGQNWDLKEAVSTILATFERVIARTAPTKKAILLIGGDILHSQNHENTTPSSGHALQVDGRFPKVLLTTCETIVNVADMHLDNHAELEIIVIPGNHDPEAAYAVQFFLHAWYRNEPRISVDLSTSLFRFREFGKVMIGTTHGHTIKSQQMPEVMAAREAEMWGRTKARYVHTFHVHHDSERKKPISGCVVETHEILAPQDSWHFRKGFLNGRSQKSITYDGERGEVSRVIESLY